MRYALILSPIVDENPMRDDTPPTDDTIVAALRNSWREVYDDHGNPVAVHEGGGAAVLTAEQARAFLTALEVGADGIDDDTTHGNVVVALANLREALA